MTELLTGSLSKVVPVHRMTVRFEWIKRDFMLHGFYRGVREKRGMKINRSCWWCKEKFVDDQMMALAGIKGTGNKLICHPCADKASTNHGS